MGLFRKLSMRIESGEAKVGKYRARETYRAREINVDIEIPQCACWENRTRTFRQQITFFQGEGAACFNAITYHVVLESVLTFHRRQKLQDTMHYSFQDRVRRGIGGLFLIWRHRLICMPISLCKYAWRSLWRQIKNRPTLPLTRSRNKWSLVLKTSTVFSQPKFLG